MKRVAVFMIALFGAGLTACAVDKPTEAAEGSRAEVRLAGLAPSAAASAEAARQHETDRVGDARVAASDVQKDRDAKEAAEDAARRIRDATLGAAARIKEVGLGAVQAVRDTAAEGDDAPPAGDKPSSEG